MFFLTLGGLSSRDENGLNRWQNEMGRSRVKLARKLSLKTPYARR